MLSQSFWTAFYAGLAAPVSLYASAPDYARFTPAVGPGRGLAAAATYLNEAFGKAGDGRRITATPAD